MNRKHLALFGLTLYGHVKPTLGLVAELVRRGHRVTYFVGEQYADLVAETGATVVAHKSGLGQYPMPLSARDSVLALTDESFAPLPDALALLADDPPDLIGYDVLVSDTARICARRFGVPLVRLYAGFAGSATVPIDRLTESARPAEPAEPEMADFLSLGRRIDELIERAGAADLVVEHETPVPGDGALSVAFVPRAFQIRAEEFDDSVVFAGPCFRADEFTGTWTPADERPVVLISLGTTTNKRPEVLRLLIQAVRDLPWRVVMTIGRDGDPTALEPIPSNVEVHRWLDQHAVLRHASLFINQGGVGSVMQSLHWGVPLLVVTGEDDTEIAGHQVVGLGVGRQILDRDLTAEMVRDEALAVLADSSIAANARAMSEHVRLPGAVEAADRMEALINQQEVARR
ncbi:macrolide family glycosyltransferase [Kutzneria sp. CA-103260]|uniref:macrolide family glycosyltransferase n=1 Tax=Kutzneria sp. CA-103260 TaxID=2802641 RepID=UPI001BABAF95|nr:macrolide family glycosyltransferase [Kutzneria sp. CA-103260]QUQ72365.1 glycosyl transferase [Kutzneria sp. CA-103260]